MKNNKNIWLVLLVVICVILAGAVGYTVLKDKKKDVPASAQTEEDSQERYISYDGKKYKANPDIKAVLFMGIDNEARTEIGSTPGNAGQADSLNVLVLNTQTKKAQIMQVSRDAMVTIDVYDDNGEKMMAAEGQICLQYAYGDGEKRSCRMTVDKVAGLLGGIDIDNYISLTMDGISAATDAIGGVTLTVPADYTAIDPAFEAGKQVTLNGEQAEMYVRGRDTQELDSNNERMERQAQFMNALIAQMNGGDMEQNEYVSLYHRMEPYMVTSMTADELKELSDYQYDSETVKVPGEVVEKDNHAQFLVNREELRAIVVKMFYKPV